MREQAPRYRRSRRERSGTDRKLLASPSGSSTDPATTWALAGWGSPTASGGSGRSRHHTTDASVWVDAIAARDMTLEGTIHIDRGEYEFMAGASTSAGDRSRSPPGSRWIPSSASPRHRRSSLRAGKLRRPTGGQRGRRGHSAVRHRWDGSLVEGGGGPAYWGCSSSGSGASETRKARTLQTSGRMGLHRKGGLQNCSPPLAP
jgi:hypothetical protein